MSFSESDDELDTPTSVQQVLDSFRSLAASATTKRKLTGPACQRIVFSPAGRENCATQTSFVAPREEDADALSLVERLQRKLFLVARERDSLKHMLYSYESEITFSGAQLEQDRVEHLEKLVSDHLNVIEHLESRQLDPAASAPQQRRDEPKIILELQEQIESLKLSLASSESAKDELQLELEKRSLRGNYDASTTRVLHLRDNPFSEAVNDREQTVRRLQEENDALKARLKLLEEGQTKDLTLLVGQRLQKGASSREVQQLKEQLDAAEVKKQRILDAFKTTSQEYREVIWQLTGYRIDGLPNKQYRLTPTFAENPADHLLFQRTPDGECQLLATPFSSSLTELVTLHLERQNSVPIFLAALNMELFSRCTFDTVEDSEQEEGTGCALSMQRS